MVLVRGREGDATRTTPTHKPAPTPRMSVTEWGPHHVWACPCVPTPAGSSAQ